MKPLYALTTIAGLALVSCTATPAPPTSASPSPTSSGSAQITPTLSPVTQTTTDLVPVGRSLTLWIAPRFAPDPSTAAGGLLAERLDAFELANPDVTVNVRLKAEQGPGGLLETLSAASTAATAALPDVISLDPVGLNAATLKGLIVPLEELMPEPAEPGWFPFAQAASNVDGGFFGLPFASDADVFAYRTSIFSTAPLSWADLVSETTTFLFPAGDPLAAFTLAQYLSLNGALADDDGRPALDPATLSDVLAFYGSANASGSLPLSARQYNHAVETWLALRENRAAAAVAPFSDFLAEHNLRNETAIPLPTKTGEGITFTQSWAWAIVTPSPERQKLAAELLSWLSAPEFLGPWTYALGFLPPTEPALELWPDASATAVAFSLIDVARPRPPEEVLATFGPPLQTAVNAVLSGGTTPDAAARAAAQAIQGP